MNKLFVKFHQTYVFGITIINIFSCTFEMQKFPHFCPLQKLHEALIEEVHEHLYWRWTREVLSLRRQGSGRDSSNALVRAGSDRASATTKADKARKNLLEMMTSPGKNR